MSNQELKMTDEWTHSYVAYISEYVVQALYVGLGAFPGHLTRTGTTVGPNANHQVVPGQLTLSGKTHAWPYVVKKDYVMC